MQIVEAKLMDLKLDPANVRQTDKAPDEGLLASIRTKGLLSPLTVRKNGAGYYVTDGGKRLAALHLLARDGEFDRTQPIPCVVRADDAVAAADTSLTLNFIREGMHPVDEFEAFANLIDAGRTPDQISKGYGIPLKQVGRSLALGRLAPEVRAAWRDEKLGEDAAQAFTLEPDHNRQDAILKKLGKWPNRWQVRNAILGEEREHGKYLAFVTTAAYEAAGGKIVKDLFAQQNETASHVSDAALLTRLVEEKIKTECDSLVAAGWGWAEYDDNNRRYQMNHLDQGKPRKDADKATAGCMLYLDHTGKLVTEKWFVKTKAAAASDKAKATKKEAASAKAPTVLSNALKQRLSSQLLKATQQALGDDTYGDALAILLAKIVASQIKPERPSWMPSEVTNKLAEVRAGITAKVMLAAVIKNFDAKNYFSSAPKGIVVSAIKEAGFSDDQFKAANKTKVDIWKFALANVPKTGWLPKELRGPYYTGPSKTAGPAKAAKKKAR